MNGEKKKGKGEQKLSLSHKCLFSLVCFVLFLLSSPQLNVGLQRGGTIPSDTVRIAYVCVCVLPPPLV